MVTSFVVALFGAMVAGIMPPHAKAEDNFTEASIPSTTQAPPFCFGDDRFCGLDISTAFGGSFFPAALEFGSDTKFGVLPHALGMASNQRATSSDSHCLRVFAARLLTACSSKDS